MRLFIVFVILIMVIFGSSLLILWMPLPASFPAPFSQQRNLFAAIVAGVLAASVLVSFAVLTARLALSNNRVLDEVMISKGLAAQRHMLVGRRYDGVLAGRVVEMTFLAGEGGMSSLFEMRIHGNFPERAAIGRKRPLLDCQDCEAFFINMPSCGQLHVAADDHTQIRSLLADPAVDSALAAVFSDSESIVSEVYLQQQRLWYRGHSDRFSGGKAKDIVDNLLSFAAHCEQYSILSASNPN